MPIPQWTPFLNAMGEGIRIIVKDLELVNESKTNLLVRVASQHG